MIPIIAAPSLPYATLRVFGSAMSAWYVKALPLLWDTGLATGVDPVVLAAQCGHETGFGKFTGAVLPSYGNPCGLKNRDATGDKPEDHARFPLDRDGLPRVGILAHAHHLRLYCGFTVPVDTPDPRAAWIGPGTAAFGSVTYVEDLGGRWAPASDYGAKVAAIVGKIRAAK